MHLTDTAIRSAKASGSGLGITDAKGLSLLIELINAPIQNSSLKPERH